MAWQKNHGAFSMTYFTISKEIVNFISDLLSIITSLIAIYLFLFKKDKIVSAINMLLNYSTQITLSELKSKLERLNDHNANNTEGKNEIINILHEIEGQIKGNKILAETLNEITLAINIYIDKPAKLTEPKKRSLVSELRERIKNLDLNQYENIINSKDNE